MHQGPPIYNIYSIISNTLHASSKVLPPASCVRRTGFTRHMISGVKLNLAFEGNDRRRLLCQKKGAGEGYDKYIKYPKPTINIK